MYHRCKHRSLLLSSSFTPRVTRRTLATAQLGEKAEEEVDAWEQEDGDENYDACKLRVILKVQEGISSRLAWKKIVGKVQQASYALVGGT